MKRGKRSAMDLARGGWPLLLLGSLFGFFLLKDPNPAGHGLDAASPMASWVSIHEAPLRQFPEWLSHPAVVHQLEADPELAERLREWSGDARVKRLFSGETVCIREPALGLERSPGLLVVSKVGWRHASLRLFMAFSAPAHLRREGQYLDKTIWKLEHETLPPLRMALARGYLLLCMHEDPNAIQEVLERFVGLRPRLRDHPGVRTGLGTGFGALDFGGPDSGGPDFGGLDLEALIRENSPPDRLLWLGTPAFPDRFRADLEVLPKEWMLRFTGPGAGRWSASASGERMEFAARFAGPYAVLVARFPAFPQWNFSQPFLLLVMGPPYFWHLNEFGAPAPVLIFDVKSTEQAGKITRELEAQLTLRTHTPWTREPVEDGWRFWPDSSDPGPGFHAANPPAAVLYGEHLIFSPAPIVVRRLLDRLERPEAEFELRDVRWLKPGRLADFDGARLPYSPRMMSDAAASSEGTRAFWLAWLGRVTRLSFHLTQSADEELILRLQ